VAVKATEVLPERSSVDLVAPRAKVHRVAALQPLEAAADLPRVGPADLVALGLLAGRVVSLVTQVMAERASVVKLGLLVKVEASEVKLAMLGLVVSAERVVMVVMPGPAALPVRLAVPLARKFNAQRRAHSATGRSWTAARCAPAHRHPRKWCWDGRLTTPPK
jgi:hypothetical protein